jgi:oligopeptide transport system substrate-binding protein
MLGRTWILVVLFALGLTAVGWAVYGSRLPPADFSFINETEVASVDPAIITGQPEGRIVSAIFEGLTRMRADNNLAEPGVAERWEVSDDGRVYTFHLRENASWSNGDPVTAHDFLYSIRRVLDPQTASRYSYHVWYIENAKRYTMGGDGIQVGDPVEVELNPPADAPNTVRGEVLLGRLTNVENKSKAGTDSDSGGKIFIVEIDGRERRFTRGTNNAALPDGVESCRQILLDFREVGVRVIDDHLLEIRLTNPTPYFLDVLSFYPMSPVHRGCLEKHGYPDWTRPENIITNGSYLLEARRIRDRVRLRKNDTYWDSVNVRLNVIDALSVDNRTTALNLYMTGMVDWVTVPPAEVLREFLKKDAPRRNDINPAPQLSTYFYLLNNKRPPLDDKRVRQALSLAIDREEIVRVATGAGEVPAHSLVPPSLPGYKQQPCAPHNPQRARELLAEAGYPEGRGFPKMEILYNTDQQHQAVAELVRKMWQRVLGIETSLRNEEWGSLQDSQQQMKYLASRRTWGGDYLDPNTFLDMYVTNGENNCTGFGQPEYDELISGAAKESDEKKRMEMLERAERLLMDEMPIIPVYYYVSRNMVRPNVRGFWNNLQDNHPLHAIWLDSEVDPNNPRPNEFMEPVQ